MYDKVLVFVAMALLLGLLLLVVIYVKEFDLMLITFVVVFIAVRDFWMTLWRDGGKQQDGGNGS